MKTVKRLPLSRGEHMARIRGKDTKPELIVRRFLHQAGFRFRLHAKGLPGRPDIVLARWRTIVFVHGCFWHRHTGCKATTTPKTRRAYWLEKFKQNVHRDKVIEEKLRRLGWRTITVWECQTRDRAQLATATQELIAARESAE